MIFFAISEKGNKTALNQDYYILPPNDTDITNGYLFIIADGLGGYNAGEIASKTASELLYHDFYKNPKKHNDQNWFINKLQKINKHIYDLGKSNTALFGMATTIVAFIIRDNRCMAFNVGDSRLYSFNRIGIKQITEDDSLAWIRYKKNIITKDEILLQSDKNIITQAIGDKAPPQIHYYQPDCNSNFLMCTDGLSDFLTDNEMLQILNSGKSEKETLKNLIKTARAKGSTDDITIILIKK